MFVNRRQLTFFLVGTFFITYALLFIMLIGNKFHVFVYNTASGMLIYILSTLSPTIMSFFILKKYKLIVGLKQYAKIAFSIKQKPIHYGLVLCLLITQYIFPALILKTNTITTWYIGIVMIIPCIFDGGLEELGWRYLLQPNLERHFSYFVATLVTAVIWILWHVPFFFIKGTSQNGMPFGIFAMIVLGNSFALSAIYRITRSIWLCILFHATLNAFSFYWPIGQDTMLTIVSAACMITLSTVVVLSNSRRMQY